MQQGAAQVEVQQWFPVSLQQGSRQHALVDKASSLPHQEVPAKKISSNDCTLENLLKAHIKNPQYRATDFCR